MPAHLHRVSAHDPAQKRNHPRPPGLPRQNKRRMHSGGGSREKRKSSAGRLIPPRLTMPVAVIVRARSTAVRMCSRRAMLPPLRSNFARSLLSLFALSLFFPRPFLCPLHLPSCTLSLLCATRPGGRPSHFHAGAIRRDRRDVIPRDAALHSATSLPPPPILSTPHCASLSRISLKNQSRANSFAFDLRSARDFVPFVLAAAVALFLKFSLF